jgi:hypothetical protein
MTMRTIITHLGKTLGLALSLSLATVALPGAARAEAPTKTNTADTKPDLGKVESHLKEHQKYPASRAELLESCKGLVDFTDGEKTWFAAHLPEGTYKSAAEVMKALRHK